MNSATSKDGLLERIERERALWDDLVVEIGEDRMLLPGAAADWSFKDVVAHLNGWRIVTLARLDAARNHSNPAAPPWPTHFDHNSEEDLDKINDWIYQAYRDRLLGEVLGEYRQSFQRMRDATAALSDQELNEVDRYPWLAGYRFADVITASFEHFHEEHEPILREWLARLGS